MQSRLYLCSYCYQRLTKDIYLRYYCYQWSHLTHTHTHTHTQQYQRLPLHVTLSVCLPLYLRHKSLRAFCLCFVRLVRWAMFYEFIFYNWDHSRCPGACYIHCQRTASQDLSPLYTECGPRVCDKRVCDGNAGPFGPPKPGVSTSDHCLINNWQRQTNQNDLLPTAKC